MAVIHIVTFQFKSTATAEQVEKTCSQMLALANTCLHPTSKGPYIKSLTGGINNSPEPHSHGLTHAFVVEFDSEGDRDYYVKDDPSHQGFINLVGPIVEKVCVVDYTVGVFK